MKYPALRFPVLAVLVGVASAMPATARADGVGCGSVDGHYNRCRVGWDDAEMVRQLSKAACIRGRTWGIERGDIWVDQGCRGSFEPLSRRGHRGSYWHDDRGPGDNGGVTIHVAPYAEPRRDDPRRGRRRERTVECGSVDHSYNFCPAGFHNRSARLVRTVSKASCREGRSWGWHDDGIWVDDGCRGVFSIEESDD